MNFDVPRHMESMIEQYADEQHISADEAISRLIQAGLNAARDSEGPPKHSTVRPPNLEVEANGSIFGLFANRPDVNDAIDAVIAGRAERYSDLI